MSLDCGRRGRIVPVQRSQFCAWRMTVLSAGHTVHMNVKALSLNPHGATDGWVFNKKTVREEKILSVPASDPK